MMIKLRRKLALLQISIVAAVVLGTAFAALAVSEHHLSLGERLRFQAKVNQVLQYVRINPIAQNAQLAKFEAAEDLILSVMDVSGPIPFRGGWQPLTDRDALISRAMAMIPDAAGSWDGVTFGDHGERYLAAVYRSEGFRGAQTAVMLEDMRGEDAQRLSQRMMYLTIAMLALAVLALFSWAFTGRAMRPIRDSYEKQNQFVAAASHELKTPMQVIRTAAETLRRNPQYNELFTTQIIDELSHMGKLTDDLLILTAAPNTGTSGDGPVDVDALLQEALDNHRSAAMQKGVELSLQNPSAPLPVLEGNEIMLQRALNVLMDNAICYTPPSGHVKVTVVRQPRTIEIAVSDDGPGIAEAHRPHIFERFYRADQSRTGRAHSGLGLSIAKQIIANHGGRLTHHPVKPHGSKFCISLPLIPNE